MGLAADFSLIPVDESFVRDVFWRGVLTGDTDFARMNALRERWALVHAVGAAYDYAAREAFAPHKAPSRGVTRLLNKFLGRHDQPVAHARYEPLLHGQGRPLLICRDHPAEVVEALRAAAALTTREALEAFFHAEAARLDPGIARIVAGRVRNEDYPRLSPELIDETSREYIARYAQYVGHLRDGSSDPHAYRPPAEQQARELLFAAAQCLYALTPVWQTSSAALTHLDGAVLDLSPFDAGVQELCAPLLDAFESLRPHAPNRIQANYMTGLYVTAARVPRLVQALGTMDDEAAVRTLAGGRDSALMLRKLREAAAYAQAVGFGLWEAADCMIPFREGLQ